MDTFSIVFVCTGNRFRSPLAEAFVRRLTFGLPVTSESFGTLELEDAPPLREAIQIGTWYGVDLSAHRTRHLGFASLENVDLLLGFDASHVRQAVVDARAPRSRSFTIRQLVRLLEEVDTLPEGDVLARARAAVQEAAGMPGAAAGPGPADGMRDPFGGPWNVYRSTAAEIRELSALLVARLFGVTDTRGLPDVPAKLARPRIFRWRR